MSVFTRYPRKDILIHKNDVEKYGFDKNLTEDQILKIAVDNKCPIVVKGGLKGKWYLKGQGRDIAYLKGLIDRCEPKYREGIYTILIEKF